MNIYLGFRYVINDDLGGKIDKILTKIGKIP